MFEPVYMAWDIYDGPRTGLVRFLGLPHYFACRMAAEGGASLRSWVYKPEPQKIPPKIVHAFGLIDSLCVTI